jgi:hypothetical protein
MSPSRHGDVRVSLNLRRIPDNGYAIPRNTPADEVVSERDARVSHGKHLVARRDSTAEVFRPYSGAVPLSCRDRGRASDNGGPLRRAREQPRLVVEIVAVEEPVL